jgi:copper(I)-binding protein
MVIFPNHLPRPAAKLYNRWFYHRRMHNMISKHTIRPVLSAMILAFSLLYTAFSHAGNAISIDDAWIAEAPPNAHVMVGYMTINNNSSQAIEIIKASSNIYSSIEFHETVHKDGMASMRRYDSLNVPANGNVQLKPGGKHMMLFNPKKALKAGDKVAITLTTKDKTSMTININVEKAKF